MAIFFKNISNVKSKTIVRSFSLKDSFKKLVTVSK